MLRIKSDLSTPVFCLVFLTYFFCSNATLESESSKSNATYMGINDFKRFKNDIFSPKKIETFKFLTSDNLKCLQELGKIAIGLDRTEEWPLKSK